MRFLNQYLPRNVQHVGENFPKSMIKISNLETSKLNYGTFERYSLFLWLQFHNTCVNIDLEFVLVRNALSVILNLLFCYKQVKRQKRAN